MDGAGLRRAPFSQAPAEKARKPKGLTKIFLRSRLIGMNGIGNNYYYAYYLNLIKGLPV